MFLVLYFLILPFVSFYTQGFIRDLLLYAHACVFVLVCAYPKSTPGTYGLRHVWLNRQLTPPTFWCNMGLWTSPDLSFSEACESLLHKVCSAMRLDQHQSLLDVAYGCGDSCFSIAQTYASQVTGITYEKGQWLFSMDRLRLQPDHVQSRVRLLQGSATDLVTALRPDTDLPFDNVLCLDAAYHFNTRALFFRQVTHVLKPGGCLGMYDLILSPSFSTRRSLPWKWRVLAKALDIPLVNWMNQQQYEAQLTQAGFDDVDIELLDPAVVFGGLSAHCFKQLSLVNHWHLGHWTHAAYLRVSGYLFGYLATAECWMPAIITARRPLSAGQSAHADKK